jgi:2-dehydro-3-deoxyphosphogluconate aldolase/(4S)-4-hydroxy-2-oxoglutarate aldolase
MNSDTSSPLCQRQQRALSLLRAAGILPIVTVDSIDQACAVAEALQRGGLHSIELTLRTPVALAAITALKREFPEIVVGAGTVLTRDQIAAAEQAGADFLVTPGVSAAMLSPLAESSLPVVPGAATPSELLNLIEHGFCVAKLFPAAAVGGIAMLKALHGPLPALMLCPTGGINEADAAGYLAQPNVACIGGSWMVPRAWLQAGEWEKVSASAARARTMIDAARAPAS